MKRKMGSIGSSVLSAVAGRPTLRSLSTVNIGAGESRFVPKGDKTPVTMNGLVYCHGIALESKDEKGSVLGHSYVHYEGRDLADKEGKDILVEKVRSQVPVEHSEFSLYSVVKGPAGTTPAVPVSDDPKVGHPNPDKSMEELTPGFLEKLGTHLPEQYYSAATVPFRESPLTHVLDTLKRARNLDFRIDVNAKFQEGEDGKVKAEKSIRRYADELTARIVSKSNTEVGSNSSKTPTTTTSSSAHKNHGTERS